MLPFYGAEAGVRGEPAVLPRLGLLRSTWRATRGGIAVREYSEGAPGRQEANMIRNFSALVTSGKLDPTWGEIAAPHPARILATACAMLDRAGARDGRRVKLASPVAG